MSNTLSAPVILTDGDLGSNVATFARHVRAAHLQTGSVMMPCPRRLSPTAPELQFYVGGTINIVWPGSTSSAWMGSGKSRRAMYAASIDDRR